MSDLTQRQLAEAAAEFLEKPLGEAYVTHLSTLYNNLHHEAEGQQLTIEQKALRVERAAGVKLAIDWLVGQKTLLDTGALDEKKPHKPS